MTNLSVSSIGERQLIERIERRVRPAPSYVRIGIGDDAAVVRPERGTEDVLTTDSLIEGTHFHRGWTPPAAIGHKALAVNLSDLAAMGASPRACLFSLGLPADLSVADFDALVDGFAALAERTGTPIVGGNIARSPGPLVLDVTIVGSVRPRRILRRTGALKGHRLYVTGEVGGAAAGLGMLAAGVDREALSSEQRACIDRHERPEPRLRFARIVARTGAASAAIDLSDGLADAAGRLAEAGGLAAVITAEAVPVAEGARKWFEAKGLDAVTASARGGEDYEVAFAVSARQDRRFLAAARRCADLRVTCVGEFATGTGLWLSRGSSKTRLEGPSFEHF